MEAPGQDQRDRFVRLLRRLAPEPGRHATPWPGLQCFHAARPTVPDPALYAPALCIVGQGTKEAVLGERVFRYDPLHYLVIGAPLPVRARVCEASDERPFLSMILQVDTAEVHDLLLEMDDGDGSDRWGGTTTPIRLSAMDRRLLDAVVRFLDAVGDPMDRRILAPAALREVVYLALQRDQGDLLRLAALRDVRSHGVAKALRFIHEHLDERLDVPAIAQEAGMSTSSLHHNFKQATTLTPVQYLKRIRLHRARQLIVDDGCQAAEAAFKVGYESPSQFSREFKRFFGMPPRRYAESWAESVATTAG